MHHIGGQQPPMMPMTSEQLGTSPKRRLAIRYVRRIQQATAQQEVGLDAGFLCHIR